MRLSTILFESPGEVNTDRTLALAFKYALKLPSKTVLVPSSRGVVARKAVEMKPDGVRLIVFTHHVGYYHDDEDEFETGLRDWLKSRGIEVVTMTHAFAGIDRGMRKIFKGIYPTEIFALALRTFGEGTKVAIEIAVMAADAGLVSTKDVVVSLGGTARGVDTAIIIKPSHTRNIWQVRPIHFICKPAFYKLPNLEDISDGQG